MAEGAAGVQRGPVAGVDAVLTGSYPMAQRCGPVTWKTLGYRPIDETGEQGTGAGRLLPDAREDGRVWYGHKTRWEVVPGEGADHP